jgi:hypothetical protein
MEETALAFTGPHVALRRRNPALAAAAVLLAAVVPPALLALALTKGLLLIGALAPLSLLTGLLLWTANLAPHERLGRLAAGELGLFFEGRRLAGLGAIRDGRVILEPGDAPIVRLTTRRGRIELRVGCQREGEALLAALGTGSPRPREVRLASRVFSDPAAFAQVTLAGAVLPLLFGAVGLLSGTHPLLCGALGVATGAVALFVLLALTAPTRLSFGEGGFSVAWLGRRRFLRHDELDGVRTWEESQGALGGGRRRGLAIFLRSGEALRFALEQDDGGAEALVDRLREAMGTRPAAVGYREARAELVE